MDIGGMIIWFLIRFAIIIGITYTSIAFVAGTALLWESYKRRYRNVIRMHSTDCPACEGRQDPECPLCEGKQLTITVTKNGRLL